MMLGRKVRNREKERTRYLSKHPDAVEIECHGGCGRKTLVRPDTMPQHDYAVCNSDMSCKKMLPRVAPGCIRKFKQGGAIFTFRFARDCPMTADEQAAVNRARGIMVTAFGEELEVAGPR